MLRYLSAAMIVLAGPVSADISVEANACIDELRAREGNVGGEVLGQEWSEAAVMVRLRDANGVEYECLVWSGPEIADFRRVGDESPAAGDGGAVSRDAGQVLSGTQRVQFDAGTSGMVMSGTLTPETSVRFVLGASDGQFLNVDIGSHGGALDYRIFNPDGSALLDLISSDTPYRGQLWQTGDHVVEVSNAGAQPVAFDIGIGID